jgi:hypothetical protein
VHGGKRRTAATAVLLLALAAPFIVQRWMAGQVWRRATPTFARATGITHPGAKFHDVAALVRYLDSQPVKHRPVFVLTGEAMIYFLSARVSALEHEEYLMQNIVRGVASRENASFLGDERRMLRRLRALRPLIVDYTRNPVHARLAPLFPKTERFLRTRYVARTTFGSYQVLDRGP